MSKETPRNDVLERTDTVEKDKKTPPYRVLLINDDYTPMDFVVRVLMEVFSKGAAEAVEITFRVHEEGLGVAGVYPFEIAETKVEEVHARARAEGHPLKATLEESDA